MQSKLILMSIFSTIFIISACSNTDNATEGNNRIIDNKDEELLAPDDEVNNDKIGFVRYSKDEMNDDAERNRAVTIDREQMANTITRLILRNEGFDEVATLVTDEEVLIAYEKNGDIEENIAADIAKKTATSVMPGFYHVYVTDNPTLISDINSLHNSSTQNKNYDNTIDRIINEMKKSPQGVNDRNQ